MAELRLDTDLHLRSAYLHAAGGSDVRRDQLRLLAELLPAAGDEAFGLLGTCASVFEHIAQLVRAQRERLGVLALLVQFHALVQLLMYRLDNGKAAVFLQ